MAGRATARPAAVLPALAWLTATFALACAAQPHSTAEPSSTWTSTLLPYRIVLPSTWTAHGAHGDEDLFESNDGRLRLKIGSGIPEPGQSVEDRVEANRDSPDFAHCDSERRADREVVLATERAILWSFQCGITRGVAVNTIHEGVGYRLTIRTTAEEEVSQLEPTLIELMSGFDFVAE